MSRDCILLGKFARSFRSLVTEKQMQPLKINWTKWIFYSYYEQPGQLHLQLQQLRQSFDRGNRPHSTRSVCDATAIYHRTKPGSHHRNSSAQIPSPPNQNTKVNNEGIEIDEEEYRSNVVSVLTKCGSQF